MWDSRKWYQNLIQTRTRQALGEKQEAFVREHQKDTWPQLGNYLRTCAGDLGHTPAQTEVIGGDFLAERFGTWELAIHYAGLPRRHKAPNDSEPFIVKQERKNQELLYHREKVARQLKKREIRQQRSIQKNLSAGENETHKENET